MGGTGCTFAVSGRDTCVIWVRGDRAASWKNPRASTGAAASGQRENPPRWRRRPLNCSLASRILRPAEPAPSLATLTAGKTAGEPGQVGAGFPAQNLPLCRYELPASRSERPAAGKSGNRGRSWTVPVHFQAGVLVWQKGGGGFIWFNLTYIFWINTFL